MLRRRVIREKSMQALFQIDVGGTEPEKALSYMFMDQEINKTGYEFARSLVLGTISQVETIDKLIAEHTPDWDIDRMANVERSVLRMAVYEMLNHSEVPVNVAINEAIELAKAFSSEESGAFVNGVLDQIRQSVEKGGKNA